MNEKKYSEEFKQIISNKNKVIRLIKNSFSDGDFNNWRNIRSFTKKAFNRDGTILDIGCANGFFLKCLREWANYNLVPYGIDIKKNLIKEAKKLFPEFSNNFALLNGEDIKKLNKVGLPNKFDFIYTLPFKTKTLKLILNYVRKNGRLIITFYGSNKYKIGSNKHIEERNELYKRINNYKKDGLKFNQIIKNPLRTNHIIALINK